MCQPEWLRRRCRGTGQPAERRVRGACWRQRRARAQLEPAHRRLATRTRLHGSGCSGSSTYRVTCSGTPVSRGAPFARASTEAPQGSSIEEVAEAHRGWLRSLFLDLAEGAGARSPQELARRLMLVYDGAAISAWMDRNPTAATAARSVATALVDAAIRQPSTPKRREAVAHPRCYFGRGEHLPRGMPLDTCALWP